jgi:Cellulase (glycosyl hydrolase family 5)/Glycosyl hydrolase catalytic core
MDAGKPVDMPPVRKMPLTAAAPHRAYRGMLLAALLAAALASCGIVGPAPAQAAEAGVVLAAPTALQISDVKALGTHWVRVFATWPDLEPQRGVYAQNWFASYESLFHSLPTGTKVIVDVVGSPEWETGSGNEHTPPANPQDYAAFVGALAQRWAGRVTAYEIWNEEDNASWWAGGPNPAAYAQLLKATYPVIKAADPSATVVLGGMTGSDYPFLEGVYAAGGKGSFDAVGVHTDTACNISSPGSFIRYMNGRMIPDSFLAYREVHAVMLANGDDKPIWMTEMSWRTTGATCDEGAFAGQKAEGVSDAEQATYLDQAFHCMAQDSYVQVALWFTMQDEGAAVSGLIRANGSRKPSFAAMQEYARHGDQATEPCGDFSGPQIDVSKPANHTTYSAALPIYVAAHDSQGVARITLEINGKLIRNFTNRTAPTTLAGGLRWHGAARIPYGRNRLTFIAVDKLRNESQVSLTIYHHRPHRRRRRHS